MLKKNFSPNAMKLPKMKPVLNRETTDEFTPASSPKNTDTESSSYISRGTSFARPNVVIQNGNGVLPKDINDLFQMYPANNYAPGKGPKEENKTVFDEISKSRYTPVVLELAERLRQTYGAESASGKKSTGSTGSPVRSNNGEQTSPRGRTPTPVSPSSGFTEEQSELAEIVDKLPESLDLSKWDDMTAIQQQNLLKNSGLTGEEQMKLLNAPTSIQTIATIQDIQANRAQHGITQAAADNISSELLKIANARIGVNNRALPFASDFQRNLFLKELDKEEQKLLESVDGQKNNGRDMLFKDNRWFDSDHPAKTPAPVIITEVDNNSKLASVAKEVLKAYMGIRVILPTTLAMISMQEIGKMIDKGTISVGGSLTGVFIGGPTVNGGLVIDHAGDVGIVYTYGGYGGTPSASAVGFVSVSNADSIKGLQGQSFEIGGSFGEGLTVGGEVATFNDDVTHKSKVAVNLNFGAGVTPPDFPFEGHAGIVNSEVTKAFNIFDTWNAILKEYNEW